jgi:NADPH2:quinone reductase
MPDGTRMRVLLLEHVGGPVREASMDRPVPQAGQLLVRIRASGVNPLDIKIRSGHAPHARQTLPAVLGLDLAGVVEQVGPGVTHFQCGDAVYGLTGGVGGLQGSLAEFAAVDAQLVAKVPEDLSMREAAAMPLAFITAWEGLVDRAAIQARQKVLVQGSGGVSDHTAGRGFDLVYDTVGGATLDASFNAVRRFGHKTVSRARSSSTSIPDWHIEDGFTPFKTRGLVK